MIERINRIALTFLLLTGVGIALGGCETWKGLGKDVQDVGESMEGGKSESDDAEGTEGDG